MKTNSLQETSFLLWDSPCNIQKTSKTSLNSNLNIIRNEWLWTENFPRRPGAHRRHHHNASRKFDRNLEQKFYSTNEFPGSNLACQASYKCTRLLSPWRLADQVKPSTFFAWLETNVLIIASALRSTRRVMRSLRLQCSTSRKKNLHIHKSYTLNSPLASCVAKLLVPEVVDCSSWACQCETKFLIWKRNRRIGKDVWKQESAMIEWLWW